MPTLKFIPVFGGIINDSILLLKGILPGGATTTKKLYAL